MSGLVCFIGLNPSKAGGPNAGSDGNDPTIRREIGFAKSWGYTGDVDSRALFSPDGRHRYVLLRPGLVKVNLFALVATNPRELRRVSMADAIGPQNETYLRSWIYQSDIVVCVWGANKMATGRDREVLALIRSFGKVPHAIRITKSGHPEHSLYLPADLKPIAMPCTEVPS